LENPFMSQKTTVNNFLVVLKPPHLHRKLLK
jgi:hypothetical protein